MKTTKNHSTVIIFAACDPNGVTAKLMKEFRRQLTGPSTIFECRDLRIKMPLIKKAKNIVVFTPTYWFGIPARLQTLIEMLTEYEEKKFDFLEGKRFAAIAYSPHGGDTECITRLGLIFNGWGCQIVPCGLMYFRDEGFRAMGMRDRCSTNPDQWSISDMITLAKRFNK